MVFYEKTVSKTEKLIREMEHNYEQLVKIDREAKGKINSNTMLSASFLWERLLTLQAEYADSKSELINHTFQLKKFETQKLALTDKINGKNLYMWAVGPKISSKPINIKPPIYFVLAGLVGLVIGIFLSLGIEFAKNQYRRRQFE